MEPLTLAALIAAIPATLAIFGGMGRYIITTILDAYKAQASATVAAKDAEIHTLDRLLSDEKQGRKEDREIAARLLAEQKELRAESMAENSRLQAVVADLRLTLTALGG